MHTPTDSSHAPAMPPEDAYAALGRDVLAQQAAALATAANRLGPELGRATQLILDSPGRLVITGVGKSALVGAKIAATMNSTGQPALFMHAADALHGDLGMLQPREVVLALSQSGATAELRALLPMLAHGRTPIIAITGSAGSPLGLAAHTILSSAIDKEACPHNLAPTTSTTLQMALGDCLAIALLTARNFGPQDFARFHPGGALGRRLYLTAEGLATGNARPSVPPTAPLHEVIYSMSTGRLGATVVIADNGTPLGIVTDGDLRRALERQSRDGGEVSTLNASQLMTPNPRALPATALATEALALLRQFSITQLPLVDGEGRYAGMVHLHDMLREGLA